MAQPSFQQTGNTLVMSNGNVRVNYNLAAGTANFYWNNSLKITNFYSGYSLNTGYTKGISYSSWSYAVTGSNQVIVTGTGSGLPVMKQYFTLDQNDSFLIRLDVTGSGLQANWMGPVVVDPTGGVNIGITNDNRALVVPFDNDGFVRYNAMPMNSSAEGYEVGAFYDNTSRNGLVVGSVTHNIWKTGVFFEGANNKLSALNVFGGATSPGDVDPHGYVSGNTVSSPTVFVGFGADWRVTMQNYAAENTNFVPRLTWTNGVPFGWNSWGVIQQNITYAEAIAVSDFFYTSLMSHNFSDKGTVYINLDSYWNNLSNQQLQTFTTHCHAHGQKAGIYFGPFVWFGAADDSTNTLIPGSTWHFSNALLRDHNGNFESVDGGLAMDPTHPGTHDMINYYIDLYTNWGFDYVKLDFLSHGSLEGAHYDSTVTTGIEAYNQGMQYVLNAINGRMFVSESIAPLFPYQYGQSRRISCDAEASLIANTEYVMNSVSYGWWLDNLYQFNDPDVMVFGNGANTNEAQSRIISGAVTGLMLDGDDLTAASGQAGATNFLTNAAMDAAALAGQTFTPVEGNTGSSSENTFVRQDTNGWYLAFFNFTSSASNTVISLSRAGLSAGNYLVTNLWDGTSSVVNGSLSVSLNAKQSKLFRLTARNPENLRWIGGNNNLWDSATANWQNTSNGQSTAFVTGDQVLFDDTAGVPTDVSLAGTVLPGGIVVNSNTNDFEFSGGGDISGNVGLIKDGNSTLSLGTANGLTGFITVKHGVLQPDVGALNAVAGFAVTNGGTLDFVGNAIAGDKPVSVAGAGVGGNGALYNSGGDLYGQMLNITLLGDTTFGGSYRWDMTNGSILSGPFNVTLKMTGGYAEWDTVNLANNVGNFEIAQGAFGFKGMGNTFGNSASTLTVDTEVDFWNSNFGANSGYAKNIHVLTNAVFKLFTSPNSYFNGNVTLESGAAWNFFYGSGSQTMNGNITLNGPTHLVTEDSTIVVSNVISGIGGFVWDVYNNAVVFTATNTYTGPTVIGGGLTLNLRGNGSISGSSLIFLGGGDSTAVHLDVSARTDKTLTLATGQTLSGIGRISGSLVVSAGATVAPAGTNTTLGITTGANATGGISATNGIILGGVTVIKLNGNGVSDTLQSTSGGITYGGTLILTNINHTALVAGNSFQIFNATGYTGAFSGIVPASPGPGLVWDITRLTAGAVMVAIAPPPPVFTGVKIAGTNLIFGGTNGTANHNYVVLTGTNLAAPLVTWLPFLTNAFDGSGNFRVTNPISTGTPGRFFLLQPQ